MINISSSFIVWYVKISLSCLASVIVGGSLVQSFRAMYKKTDPWKLTALCLLCPFTVFFALNIAVEYSFCDRVVADAFSFGVVMGILYQLNYSLPTGTATVKLIGHRLDGQSEAIWLDSVDSTVSEARTKLGVALNISPVTRICLESGKGCFLEDMDQPIVPLLHTERDFFGFTTVQCYFCVQDNVSGALIHRRGSDNGKSFMSIPMSMMGMSNKVTFGQHLHLTAKVFNKNTEASRDVRALTIAPIEKFAAAAPSRGMTSVHVRLLSWQSVKHGDVELFSDTMPSDLGMDTVTDGGSGTSSPLSVKSKWRLNGKKMVSRAGKLLSGNLESSLPIRNGEIVVVESDGKFMAIAKGWWMGWDSATPRRSGAFQIEILERNEGLEQQLEKGLKNIKDKMNSSFASSAGIGSSSEPPSKANKGPLPIETDAILRAGDSFRLRSMKFPEYELGVTSDKIKDEYCYVGLRKVNDVVTGGEWCMPVRFSVKATVFHV